MYETTERDDAMHALRTEHDLAEAGPETDTELIGRALRGEQSAFEAIMRRHNRLLFRCARGVVDDDAEAQDVVQEAYLRAFASLHAFRADAALGTWLARIAINAALDAQRRRGRSVPLLDSIDSQDPDAEPVMEHTTAFNAPGKDAPDAQAERSEMRALLQRAIDSLPVIYRSVFILRAVEELSVSRDRGVPPAQRRSRQDPLPACPCAVARCARCAGGSARAAGACLRGRAMRRGGRQCARRAATPGVGPPLT